MLATDTSAADVAAEPEFLDRCGNGAFRKILESLPASMHRQLGYFGDALQTLFYFDHRAQDIIWDDGRSYGIGTGGWQVFAEVIEPIARKYGVEIGGNRPAVTALVLDRSIDSACFAKLSEARRLVRHQHQS